MPVVSIHRLGSPTAPRTSWRRAVVRSGVRQPSAPAAARPVPAGGAPDGAAGVLAAGGGADGRTPAGRAGGVAELVAEREEPARKADAPRRAEAQPTAIREHCLVERKTLGSRDVERDS